MGTKEDLPAAIMQEGLDRLVRAAEQALASVHTPSERLATLVQLHVLTHAVRPLETRIVDGEIRALAADRRAEIVTVRDRYEAFWQQAIDAGCAAGGFQVAAPRAARLALL